jgi:transcriptional regulator with XRE-family HTH domain
VRAGRTLQQAKQQDGAAASNGEAPVREILIGRKVKQARLNRNMRLKELAERSGFSESLISKIENDKTTPSLMTLHRIAVALDTNISWFFSNGPTETSPVLRAGERQVIRTDKERATTESFVPYGGTHLLQAFLVTIHPGGTSLGPREHPGEEVGYIIDGELDLTIAGTTYHLKAGDSFNFRSERPHSYRNGGRKDVRIVWVNTPPTL